MRKLLVVSLTLLMMLTACGDKGGSGDSGRGSSDSDGSLGTHLQVPLPGEDDVQFELDGSDPNFTELQQPAVDLSNTPDYTNQGVDTGAEGTGVGSPTGELPNGGVGGDQSEGGAAADSGSGANGGSDSGSVPSAVTPENKYPNTGLFPEDD